MVAAIVAGVLGARAEGDDAPRTRLQWSRAIGYWVLTTTVAFEMAAGGVWDLLRIEFVRISLTRLGYPLYLLYILGPPKILCAIALLVPRFPRLKEWAYAGAFFNYAGAAASLVLTGRNTSEWMAPLVFAVLTMGSWAMRPASRKATATRLSQGAGTVAWCVPAAIVAAMLVVSFLTLPTGAPPR